MSSRRYPRQFRQLLTYGFAGVLTAVAHYGVLIGLVGVVRPQRRAWPEVLSAAAALYAAAAVADGWRMQRAYGVGDPVDPLFVGVDLVLLSLAALLLFAAGKAARYDGTRPARTRDANRQAFSGTAAE